MSSLVGSSALPSLVPALPASVDGELSRASTAVATGWPVHAARSASLGPKPARQNRRSTMAGLID